jgi:DUF2075 family protein
MLRRTREILRKQMPMGNCTKMLLGRLYPTLECDENTKSMRRGIPKSQYWVYDEAGIDQVGCVYTAQGFEFDYAGGIFGNDLKYNPDTGEWEGFPENSHDGQVKGSENFVQLVKNTYRVLLGRGMKACYVYFMDKETERYFRSRVRR